MTMTSQTKRPSQSWSKISFNIASAVIVYHWNAFTDNICVIGLSELIRPSIAPPVSDWPPFRVKYHQYQLEPSVPGKGYLVNGISWFARPDLLQIKNGPSLCWLTCRMNDRVANKKWGLAVMGRSEIESLSKFIVDKTSNNSIPNIL